MALAVRSKQGVRTELLSLFYKFLSVWMCFCVDFLFCACYVCDCVNWVILDLRFCDGGYGLDQDFVQCIFGATKNVSPAL